MNKNFLKLIFAVTLSLAAITQLQSQPNVPILTVDTLVNLGKTDPGEAGGALFLPDGNVIALWKSIPHIIDAKTGEVLRRLDTVHSSTVYSCKLSKDGTKLVAISMGPKLVVWDIPTGKLIKPPKDDLISFCLSPDGTKMYCTQKEANSATGVIAVYDMNTLTEIERIMTKGFVEASYIAISPDGQTLAVSVYKKPNNEYDKKTNQVILIDLKDKTKFTVLETLEPQVYSMEFSPDGKQITFAYGGISPNIYIYIYNLDTKEKKYISQSEFQNQLGNKSSFGFPYFINENNLIFGATMENDLYAVDVTVTWDILENSLKKVFELCSPAFDMQNKKLLLCSWNGAIAILDSESVSVKDDLIKNENYLQYTNNQLEYYSDKAFIGESMIYDTTGKILANLGSQPFILGKNIIRINQPLQKGVYLLTIKNGTEQNSYKFIVE